MRGMSCPACGALFMSFSRFLCEVDVNTVMKCDACATALRRSRAAFAMYGTLGLGFGIAGVMMVRVTLGDPTGASLVALGLFFVAAPLAFLLLGKFIAWRYVPWVPVESNVRVAAEPVEKA